MNLHQSFFKHKNLVITLLLVVFIMSIFTITQPLHAHVKPVTIHLNGVEVKPEVQPYIDGNNRTMVPLRFIMENFGSSVFWDGDARKVSIKHGTKTAHLWIDNNVANIDDTTVTLDTTPIIKQGRTMVPLRFISEDLLDAQVEWNADNKVANVIYTASTDEANGIWATITPNDPNSKVNVRSGPGLGYQVKDNLGWGTTVELLSKHQDWYQVSVGGKQGWIAASLLTINENDTTPEDDQVNENIHGLTLIEGVTVNKETDRTIIKIAATEQLKFSYHIWNNKLIIDLDKSYLPDELIGKTLPVNNEQLLQVRLSQFTPQSVRVVGDFTKYVKVNHEVTDNGKTISFSLSEVSGDLAGKTIVIDPGHGSIQSGGWLDPGAVGPTGLHERVVALDISTKLAKMLEGKGATVILTHTGSTHLTLAGRAQLATDNNADIFVSIHANANVNRNINGTMTFYHNNTAQAAKNQQLANFIQNSLVKEINRKDLGLATANFSVLRNATVPAVLVETAFISNYEEERLLADPHFRSKTAQGISNGIERYFMAQ